jgi:predicted transposase YbfD/YdcC
LSKKTLNLILASDCHFLIQLKGNCNKLYELVALYTALTRPLTSQETYETQKGRKERRWVGVYANRIELPKGWRGIQRFVKVRRSGIRDGKSYENTAFYILSRPIDKAWEIAPKVRQHWAIENGLHWVKDVFYKEDSMHIKHPKIALSVAFINTTALNLLRLAGFKPILNDFVKFANNVKELNKMLIF